MSHKQFSSPIKTVVNYVKYHLACRKFFPLQYRATNELYKYCNDTQQAVYPSPFPIDSLNTGFNEYNVITKTDLYKFYYGNLSYSANAFGDLDITSSIKLTPDAKSSQNYQRLYRHKQKMMKIECRLIQGFAKKRLVTLKDVAKLLHVDQNTASKIWNSPEVTNIGYPINESLGSHLRFNVCNSILSSKIYYGYKRVNHNDIATSLYLARRNYKCLKLQQVNNKWQKAWQKGSKSQSDLINHSIQIAKQEIDY